jgi:hypothetical protein
MDSDLKYQPQVDQIQALRTQLAALEQDLVNTSIHTGGSSPLVIASAIHRAGLRWQAVEYYRRVVGCRTSEAKTDIGIAVTLQGT